jgi:hypothetical protein
MDHPFLARRTIMATSKRSGARGEKPEKARTREETVAANEADDSVESAEVEELNPRAERARRAALSDDGEPSESEEQRIEQPDRPDLRAAAAEMVARGRERAQQIGSTLGGTAARARRQSERVVRRAGKLVKEHPTATAAAVLTGALALAKAELAAGALLGIGVTVLVAKRSGAETRKRVAGWIRRSRALLTQGLDRLESVVEPPAAPAQP